ERDWCARLRLTACRTHHLTDLDKACASPVTAGLARLVLGEVEEVPAAIVDNCAEAAPVLLRRLTRERDAVGGQLAMKALKIRDPEADDGHARAEHCFAVRPGSDVAVLVSQVELRRLVLGRNDREPTEVGTVRRVVAKLESQLLRIDRPRLVLVGHVERYDIYLHDFSSWSVPHEIGERLVGFEPFTACS